MARPRILRPMSGPRHGADDLEQFASRLVELRATLTAPDSPGAFEAYTDGACLKNPDGPGGWAAVISALDGESVREWELWGHLASTSNNRAEALGLLAAMCWVPEGSSLVLYSDSDYAVNVLAGRYRARANVDVWDEVKRVRTARRLAVEPRWVRGHVGTEGNERADRLAVLGAVQGDTKRAASLRSAAAARPARRTAVAPAVPAELAGIEPRGPWEASFFDSIKRQVSAGKVLSEKQRAVVDRMRARGATAAPS